jgi:hypothetical protein
MTAEIEPSDFPNGHGQKTILAMTMIPFLSSNGQNKQIFQQIITISTAKNLEL